MIDKPQEARRSSGPLADSRLQVNLLLGRFSRECVHAFAECIRAQARGQRAAFETNADVLRRAMAAENAGAMTEGVEADGGLLVPHGPAEAILTIAGVGMVASAHIMNLRLAR